MYWLEMLLGLFKGVAYTQANYTIRYSFVTKTASMNMETAQQESWGRRAIHFMLVYVCI